MNRKGYNSLNVLVVGGFDKLIYDLMTNVPGNMHDATTYGLSEFKVFLESQFPRHICLGDSAFPISEVMMVPYPKEQEHDRNKALFNIRLSGARVQMTKKIFGK